MLRRPRFKPHLRVEIVPSEGVFLLSEMSQTVLQGRLYELVAPCLDGRPLEAISAQLRGRISAAEIYYVLGQLEKKGYLAESDSGIAPGEAGLYSMQGVDPQTAAKRLAGTPLTIRVAGAVDIAPFRALLQSLHVQFADEGQWTVVVTDSYLRSDLQAINQEALRTCRPWLLVRIGGSQVWLGPLFRPGHTGCWACLAERFRANSPVGGYLEEKYGNDGGTFVDHCRTAATLQVGWGLAATAVASWIVGVDLSWLDGKVQTLNVLTNQTHSHTLMRQPSCIACGKPESSECKISPVKLHRCQKTFTQDGGHRAVSPQETLDRFSCHVSPITGAVSMLEKDGSNGDGLLHVYVSGNNVARRPKSLGDLRSDLRSSTSGKGTTELQAKASALCEGLERYSAVYRGDEPRRRARFVDLGAEAIHPSTFLLFSDLQYREREARNAHRPAHDEIPLPFDAEAEIDWTPTWSLSRQAVCWLPTAFCYFHAPHTVSRTFCWSDSNGNAAGNTREEAILQGFLELVERDSVALWWYNRVRRPAVNLDSFADPYLPALRALLASRHRDLWILDLTSDLGVPAFAAISRRTDGGMEQIMLGFGAHLDARLAVLRAVTEMIQIHSQLLDAPGDQLPAYLTAKQTVEWLRTATVDNQPYLLPLEGMARDASSYRPCETDDLLDDVLACQALVERNGMEMLVLDQTRSEIGLPVVKVVVPGLRHFWARFAPGRLYDVPVRLGWRTQPVSEKQLNPIPMFL
jgi:bacteriocin biosynthesis cyclodehydratase domain-containing protein